MPANHLPERCDTLAAVDDAQLSSVAAQHPARLSGRNATTTAGNNVRFAPIAVIRQKMRPAWAGFTSERWVRLRIKLNRSVNQMV